MQRTAFDPNDILVQGSMNLLDCDNPNYYGPTAVPYLIYGPALDFDITCGSNIFTVSSQPLSRRSMPSHCEAAAQPLSPRTALLCQLTP